MADSPILPGDRAWRDASGKPLPVEFYRFLRDLVAFVRTTSGNEADLAALLARVDALEGEASSAGTLSGPYSVAVFGNLADGAITQLVNDSGAPGNTHRYGTNATGAKGWFPIADALAAGTNITLNTAADGVTTIAATAGDGVLPVVTGEVPPVLVYLDDGSLVYSGV